MDQFTLDQQEFEFKGTTFVIRKRPPNNGNPAGGFEFRDKAHLSPQAWSSVVKAVANTSLDRKFRKLLADAVEQLQ